MGQVRFETLRILACGAQSREATCVVMLLGIGKVVTGQKLPVIGKLPQGSSITIRPRGVLITIRLRGVLITTRLRLARS